MKIATKAGQISYGKFVWSFFILPEIDEQMNPLRYQLTVMK